MHESGDPQDEVLKDGVPNPTVLLGIQLAGGLLSLLPIISLNQFARPAPAVYQLLVAGAVVNVVMAASLLIGFIANFRYLLFVIKRIGEIGICRVVTFYDIIMLGSLVCLTGGSENSAFAPQFAAVLPMAMLIRDIPAVKWAYATVFLLMFLLGLQMNLPFQYLAGSEVKVRWFLVFFFIFTLFPVIYSIQTERTSS